MIEQALLAHLQVQQPLTDYLATYANQSAIFNQEAPADKDGKWGQGPQYGRIVFSEDIQGDPERTMGGMLTVDILCKEGEQFPEEIEPIIRPLIHGYFFSNGTFVVAAQWKNTQYFTEPTDHVIGCTVTFDLLGFPTMTTGNPDVIARINEWTSKMNGIHVINYDKLPSAAWKPSGNETAVYWRVLRDAPANWIPDTFQTIWRTATIKGHVFSKDIATASAEARRIRTQLYASKRLLKAGESPIMVNRNNTVDDGADPLRTGQMTVEATYGEIVFRETGNSITTIQKSIEGETQMATAKTKATATAPEKVAAPIVKSTYTVAELVENHKAFNTYREIVDVALRLAGKKEYTFEEAEEIINKFKNKEVK